jgi:hypothetical protein
VPLLSRLLAGSLGGCPRWLSGEKRKTFGGAPTSSTRLGVSQGQLIWIEVFHLAAAI